MRTLFPLLIAISCNGVQPLDLPADPAQQGVPVGVRTLSEAELTLEVWYPAPDEAGEEALAEAVDVGEFIPAEVQELLGDVQLPTIDSYALRDAALRDAGEPYPVILFSHGFGGFRTQSVDYTQHLASRGYVVVAVDHPGRMLGDVLPCVFSPPLDACQIDLEDPAEDQLPDALELVDGWAAEEEGFFFEQLDMERLGLTGHSAGANSTATVGEEETRFDALLPMAGNGTVARNVPVLVAGGTCDVTMPFEETEASAEALQQAALLSLTGAGHLAFTDLCDLELGALADEVLAPRDDINSLWLEQLRGLAVDGCPYEPPPIESADCEGAFWPLDESQLALRHYATLFFDVNLRHTESWRDDGLSGAELR